MSLQSIYLIDSEPSQSSYQSGTLQFVANIQGNLGASLDDSWATGQERELEEDEEIQYSDHPFATGLLGTKRNTETERVGENIENILPIQ